jgi:5'-3' exonuclease
VSFVSFVYADGIDLAVLCRLWEPGYKERYYRQKFHLELTETESIRK